MRLRGRDRYMSHVRTSACRPLDLYSELPDLVLLRLADFLKEEDTTRLGMTCRRLRDLLPRFLVMRGEDFSVPGSGTWWGDLELYFDGPRLPAGVKRLTVSVAGWKDQG